ncbi:MAG: DMT family transporter [Syntrophomonadaceae bacterium]|jgi:drug/metabolite transporter (DMT)-like permease|nr:DMT family transporter [Syntrophomonadaceae bacterium]
MQSSGNLSAVLMKERLNSNFAKKGIFTGLFSGCTWGMNSVLLGIALGLVPVLDEKAYVFALPLAAAFFSDFIAGLWLLAYNGVAGRVQEIWRTLKTFPGLMVCVAALLGGPIAMGGYLMGISMAGPAYALPITALYPVVGAILSRIFLKQVIIPRVWLGIALSIAGAIVISYVPPEGTVSSVFYLGLIFASLAAFGWGSEAVLSVFGMNMVDPKVAINIRQLTSGLVMFVFVLPFVGGWGVASQVVTLPNALGVFALAALASAASYLAWYKANNMIGVAKGVVLNGTYVMWGVVFSVLFMSLTLTQNLVIGSVLIMIGAALVAVDPKELFKKGGKS